MKVLFAASESVPFVKTGGLGDVIGSLPACLARLGVDVRVILPKYRDVDAQWKGEMKHVLHFYISLGWRRQYCGIEMIEHDGVIYYFVDNEFYFARESIYGSGNEEGERFGYFCRAVLEALPHLNFEPDVLHCNDWQTGMIPALLLAQYRDIGFYARIRTVFTIHNLKFQGIFPYALMDDMLGLGERYFTPDALEFYGNLSFIKGGLVFSDVITTVSPTYAREIQMPYYGEHLDGLLRARSNVLSGILNGIDTERYNPRTDPYIAQNYSARALKGKAVCKIKLQEELGLEKRENVPIISIITRLTEQKGLDLIERVLGDIMSLDVQMIVLGMGEEKYSEAFCWASWRFQGRMAARIEHNDALAHRIYAGSDIYLMPSKFEPCGLSQMISMRYGAVPIVRETGGLADSVKPYNEHDGTGNGFSFANYNAHEMLHTIERAYALYQDKDAWGKIVLSGMNARFSWERSAKHYLSLYNKLLKADDTELKKPGKTTKSKGGATVGGKSRTKQ